MPFIYNNAANAFDGNPLSFASGQAANDIAICVWKGWGAAAGPYSSLGLYIDNEIALPTGANSTAWLGYTTDNGVTWTTVYSLSGVGLTRARTTDVIALPPGTNLSAIQVRASIQTGSGTTSQHRIYTISTTGALAGATVTLLPLVNQSAKVCVTPPIDPQETAIRLYRRGGTLPDNWFQIGQFPISSLTQGTCGAGTLEIDDNVPDSTAQIGPLLPQDNFPPVQSVQATNLPLPVIFGPYDQRVLGCGDPSRPESVYFTIRGNADIWPVENWVVVANPGEQMMNGIVYSLRCFAFSRERMHIMLPNIIAGVTFTPSPTACRRGLKGRWALCEGEQGIYFISKDGAYRTQGGPEQSIIDDSIRPLFPVREGTVGKPTNGYDAVDLSDEDHLRLVPHNGEVWFFYTGLTTQLPQLLIYDERRNRWRGASYPDQEVIAYSEPNTSSSLLLGAVDGDIYQIGGAVDGESQTDITVNFRTGAFDQGRPLNLKEYVNVFVDIDPGGATVAKPVVLTPIVNGETITEAALQITGTGRQRVPLPLNQAGSEVYAYNLEFDFAWAANAAIQPVAYQYDIEYRHEPAEMTRWELPQSSMGFEGWFHLRDIYIVLRSNAPVTFTVMPDGGVPQVFILPSTNGAKDTVYIQLGPSKANSYGFLVTSTAPFRLYAEEIEVRGKQWLTKLGYKSVPVIGREQVGHPFGLTNV